VESENIPMPKQALVKQLGELMKQAASPATSLPTERESTFVELGRKMAEDVWQMAYDPMPNARGIRGIMQLTNAHGTTEQREKADAEFKSNCAEFQTRFGLGALVARLNRTYIGAYADSINRPVETVSFSEALNWRSNQPQVLPQ
jgi:hypothetical protein